YESLVQPLAILSILPSAGIGALVALLVFDGELNLISLLGLFLLVGVVMKNTILMVDFALAAQREDRKSTRLNSSHVKISYAVFCAHRDVLSFPTRRSSDLTRAWCSRWRSCRSCPPPASARWSRCWCSMASST